MYFTIEIRVYLIKIICFIHIIGFYILSASKYTASFLHMS